MATNDKNYDKFFDSYKQGFLNVIARWNAASKTKNGLTYDKTDLKSPQERGQIAIDALESVKQMGADKLGNYTTQSFTDAVSNWTAPGKMFGSSIPELDENGKPKISSMEQRFQNWTGLKPSTGPKGGKMRKTRKARKTGKARKTRNARK